jgi:hypothetical protein
MGTVLEGMAQRYTQLYLEPAKGMSESEIYKDIVLRGKKPDACELHGFLCSPMDRLYKKATPAGDAEILYLRERKDFERFIRIMMYKCEPVIIQKSMGAAIICGITNWQKIEKHQMQYLHSGNWDLAEEFKRFTGKKSNYLDTLIVVSYGEYSNLNYKSTLYSKEDWLNISLEIRIYHECTHYICRKLYPKLINALWDEILADCIGLLNGTGHYDASLAKALLGVSAEGFADGGRLSNYINEKTDISATAVSVSNLIDRIADITADYIREGMDYFAILMKLEENSKELYGQLFK